MLFLYEIKKIYKNKLFIGTIILFLMFNVLCIFSVCYDYLSDDTYKTELNLTDKFEGAITLEKVDLISNKYNELSKFIENNSYSTEYNSSTYTGYQMMDYNVFSKLYDEISRIYNFSNETNNKVDSIKQSMQLFNENYNKKQYNRYEKTVNAINHRTIDEIHNYTGVNEYINYDLSFLFIAIIAIFIAVFEFSSDKEMVEIIYTGSHSKKKIFVSKISSIFLNIILISFAFKLVDFILFKLLLGLRGINCPLYYLEKYEMTCFNGSIFEFSIISIIGVIISALLICIICCILTVFLRKSNYSMITSIVLFSLLFGTFQNKYNPVTLIYLNQDFKYPSFFGTMPIGYAKIVIWSIALIVTTILLYFIHRGIIKNGNIKI